MIITYQLEISKSYFFLFYTAFFFLIQFLLKNPFLVTMILMPFQRPSRIFVIEILMPFLDSILIFNSIANFTIVTIFVAILFLLFFLRHYNIIIIYFLLWFSTVPLYNPFLLFYLFLHPPPSTLALVLHFCI